MNIILFIEDKQSLFVIQWDRCRRLAGEVGIFRAEKPENGAKMVQKPALDQW